MSDPGTPVIELREVSFAYPATPVLRDVNLALHAREVACLVGPNGGGKTTLLRLILGLLKPDRGTIRVLGRAPEDARRRLGYVPQYMQFDPRFPASVKDVVRMGRLGGHLLGWLTGDDKAIAHRTLGEVGLEGLDDRAFSDLSGGQRQRVLIARALASQPEILLLDEPTANVDTAAQEKLFDLLETLSERLTIIMVSHDLGVVTQWVDRIVCVHGTVKIHPTSEFTGDLVRELYGTDISLVRHDHRCSDGGHACPPS